jgi:hypothetical protein
MSGSDTNGGGRLAAALEVPAIAELRHHRGGYQRPDSA